MKLKTEIILSLLFSVIIFAVLAAHYSNKIEYSITINQQTLSSNTKYCNWTYSNGDKQKDNIYNKWRNDIDKSDSTNIESVLLKIAGELQDENDFGVLMHLIAFNIDEDAFDNISLLLLLNACRWKGNTHSILESILFNKIPVGTDIHLLTNNSYIGNYFYKFGRDENGKKLDTWTIGDVWLLDEISNDPFPKIKVTIKTFDRQKAREAALLNGNWKSELK